MFKKSLVIFVFTFSLSGLFAQGNLIEMDYKLFRLGFSLGTNYMHLDVINSQLEQDGKIYYGEVSHVLPGFSVGLITDLRLHRYFNLRATPTLLLGERHLYFKAYDTATGVLEDDQKFNLFSLPIDFPVSVRYSAERYGNLKPFVQMGGGVYFDLGRDELTEVTLRLFDYYYSVGMGCEVYFRYFKLSPELKLNLGVMNVLSPKHITDDNVVTLRYTNAISQILSRVLVFSLNIE